MNDPRAALEAIGQLPDVEIDLADAALQLARIDAPDADWQLARTELSELARDAVAIADRLNGDLTARAGALAKLIAGRHRFRGDAETYEDPANANLIRVLERRRGLPVTLGILWLHCARAAGWDAHGVDFPGHFLVVLDGPTVPGALQQTVLDPFASGAALDAPALRALLKRVEGASAELRPGVLQPMSARSVLLRLQNNVKVRRLRAGELTAALACTEDMLRIAPDTAGLWREAAVMNQSLGRVTAALRCYEGFLHLVPEGEAAARAKVTMEELRTRLN